MGPYDGAITNQWWKLWTGNNHRSLPAFRPPRATRVPSVARGTVGDVLDDLDVGRHFLHLLEVGIVGYVGRPRRPGYETLELELYLAIVGWSYIRVFALQQVWGALQYVLDLILRHWGIHRRVNANR
jgi:hypothetical protein